MIVLFLRVILIFSLCILGYVFQYVSQYVLALINTYIYIHMRVTSVCVCVFFNGMMLIIYIYTVYIWLLWTPLGSFRQPPVALTGRMPWDWLAKQGKERGLARALPKGRRTTITTTATRITTRSTTKQTTTRNKQQQATCLDVITRVLLGQSCLQDNGDPCGNCSVKVVGVFCCFSRR